jgi:hypothetical protein
MKENIQLHLFDYAEITMLLKMAFENAPVIMALQWLNNIYNDNKSERGKTVTFQVSKLSQKDFVIIQITDTHLLSIRI